jgi:hypothetical protein
MEAIMMYFVKNGTVHRYPVPKRCGEFREQEQLRDTIPHGAKECLYCLRRWPQDDDNNPLEPVRPSNMTTTTRGEP